MKPCLPNGGASGLPVRGEAMMRSAGLGALLLVAGLSTGCVTRSYTITTDPPNAVVYRNGIPVGPTPAEESFVYYGNYHFTIVKEGYETLQVDERIASPWYQYPVIDFLSENVWPFKLRDAHTFCYQLRPLQQVRQDEVLDRARALRGRGQAIGAPAPPPPSVPPPEGAAAPAGLPAEADR
jgi:hypothetical protein